MTQEYARVSVEMPENEDKKSLRQALDLGRFACKELTYEIENNDIQDEFTIKFGLWKREAIPIRLHPIFNGNMRVMA